MIRYYTYYSCGGYKDLYIGADTDLVDARYFVPLLNVWKKVRNRKWQKRLREQEMFSMLS